MFQRLYLGAVIGFTVCAVAVPAAAHPRQMNPWMTGADAPSPSAVVEATNAMLREADVPKIIATTQSDLYQGSDFRTGYTNSFAGEDPVPVCTSPRDQQAVYPSWIGALVYRAAARGVDQFVYEYPSAEMASAAWNSLVQQLRSKCQGRFKQDGVTYSADIASIPGAGGMPGWGVTSSVSGEYAAVHLLGSAIQMVAKSDVTSGDMARMEALNSLAILLAGRWLERATLQVNQDPLITRAARTMLQPGDVPAATPVTLPANGGAGSFDAFAPGARPTPCNDGLGLLGARLPMGGQSFHAALGGDGDPESLGGVLEQRIFTYDSPAQAKMVWGRLTRELAKCELNSLTPVPANEPFDRQLTGRSAATFEGVPGLWLRGLSIRESGVSVKWYTIDFLMNDAIQRVTYMRTIKGMRQVPLDQLAINALAEQLALRWTLGSASGSS